jgi:hypothetical protein
MLVEDVGDSKEYRVLDPSRLPQSKPHHMEEFDDEQQINQRQTVFMKEGMRKPSSLGGSSKRYVAASKVRFPSGRAFP